MCHPCLQYLAFACLSILTVILQAYPPFNGDQAKLFPVSVLPVGHTQLLPPHASSRAQHELHLFRKARPLYPSRHSYSVLLVPFTFFTALSQLKCIYQSLLLASFLCVPLCCKLREGREGAGFACHLTPGTSVPQRTGDQEIWG